MKIKRVLPDKSTTMFDLELYNQFCKVRDCKMITIWRLKDIPKHKIYDFLRKEYYSSPIKIGTTMKKNNGEIIICQDVVFEHSPGGWIMVGKFKAISDQQGGYWKIIKNVNSWMFEGEGILTKIECFL